MIQRYCGGTIPSVEDGSLSPLDFELKKLWDFAKSDVIALFESYLFSNGLEKLFRFIRELNRYIEVNAPWKLAKSTNSADIATLRNTMACLAEGIRLANVLLAPIIPDSCLKVSDAFEAKSSSMDWDFEILANSKISADKLLLFPKKD